MQNQEGKYYEVSRQQALGICFMRWYNIAAKLYDLKSVVVPNKSKLNKQELYINYKLFNMANFVFLK
jgi:hypothetical protein